MGTAYYSKGADSKELFSKFKVSETDDFKKYLNKFNVIKIDLNGIFAEWKSSIGRNKPETAIQYLTNLVCREFKEYFSDIDFNEEFSLAGFILKVYVQKKETFIVIVDEYDVLVREQVPESEFQQYLDFLNSLFKNESLKPAISLAYLTGILPIVRDKIQSKLNTFYEITMLQTGRFAEFTGFTTDGVQSLCENYSCDFLERNFKL